MRAFFIIKTLGFCSLFLWACSGLRQQPIGGDGSSSLTDVAIKLPSKSGLPNQVNQALTGFRFSLSSVDANGIAAACPGFTNIEKIDAYTANTRLQGKLKQGCNYHLTLEMGTMEGTALPTAKVLYRGTKNITRDQIQGKNQLSVSIDLLRTPAGDALAGPNSLSTGETDIDVNANFPSPNPSGSPSPSGAPRPSGSPTPSMSPAPSPSLTPYTLDSAKSGEWVQFIADTKLNTLSSELYCEDIQWTLADVNDINSLAIHSLNCRGINASEGGTSVMAPEAPNIYTRLFTIPRGARSYAAEIECTGIKWDPSVNPSADPNDSPGRVTEASCRVVPQPCCGVPTL